MYDCAMKVIPFNKVFMNIKENLSQNIMATNEEADDAEQLRLLALQSMVRRTIKNNSSQKSDDQDILLLRTAALESIGLKTNNKNSSINELKNNHCTENRKTKRSQSDSLADPLNKKRKIRKKRKNSIKCFNTDNVLVKTTELENIDEKKYEHSVKPIKPEVKKIVKNGSILLSNLNSEGIDETMVIKITFSSSESDDSSSENDNTLNTSKAEKNISVEINNDVDCLKRISSKQNISEVDSINKVDSVSIKNNKLKFNDCILKLSSLMKSCDSEIEKREAQLKIFLEAYEKYENHNRTVYSLLESIKAVRKELSELNSNENTSISIQNINNANKNS